MIIIIFLYKYFIFSFSGPDVNPIKLGRVAPKHMAKDVRDGAQEWGSGLALTGGAAQVGRTASSSLAWYHSP